MFNFTDLNMQKIDFKVAKQYISENHYSHTIPSSVKAAIGFYHKNKLVTAIIYGYPVGINVTKWMKTGNEKNCIELVRLFSKDGLPKNTESYCIGMSFKYLKKNYPSLKYIISYADPNYNHVGCIYQATNWLYVNNPAKIGKHLLFFIDGISIHPRTLYAKHGTSNLKKMQEIYGNRLITKKCLPKYIYLMCLGNKRDRKNWYRKFESKSYPKLGDKHV